ncbi:MAG: glycosyltransferase family 4 protein [Geminicoccaceae bacterium]
MKIIYAYEGDAENINVQSGRPYAVLRQLERLGHQVVRAFPLEQHWRYLFAWKYLPHRYQGSIYRPDREPLYLRSLARQVVRRTKHADADLIMAPGSHVLAHLETDLPVVYFADATFANVLDFYDSFENCAAEYVEQGHDQEQRVLTRCAAAIFPSSWAAESAVTAYAADPERLHIVPFGSNLQPPAKDQARTMVRNRASDRLNILFVGRDWHRKGGDIVLDACTDARRRGIPVELDIVGVAKLPYQTPSWTRVHGLLDKRASDQLARLTTLFGQAHLLFVPSRAENYGMTFCEAAGFGVPALTTAVGGIPTIVTHGKTGFTLPAHAEACAYADILADLYRSPERLVSLANACLDDYHARLNWDAFGDRLEAILGSLKQQPSKRN